MLGRRRIAVAALVVAVITIGVLAGTGRPERKPTTTPEALAAAAMRHVPEGLQLVKAEHSPDDDPANRLLVHLVYNAGGQQAEFNVEVHAKANAPTFIYELCDSGQAGGQTTCEYRNLPDGTKTAVLRSGDVIGVAVTQPTGDIVIASVPSAATAGPFDLALLTTIATDPLVALTTTQELLDAGGNVHFT